MAPERPTREGWTASLRRRTDRALARTDAEVRPATRPQRFPQVEIEAPVWEGRASLMMLWPTIRPLLKTAASVFAIRIAFEQVEFLAPVLEIARPMLDVVRPYWAAIGWAWWIGVPAMFVLWRWIQIACIQYEMTPEYVRISTGVFSRYTWQGELYRMRGVYLSEPWWLRLAGCGTVRIGFTENPGSTVELAGIESPAWVRDQISQRIEAARDGRNVRVAEWL